MDLPEYVAACLNALENAGFAAYAVGGCVRDTLLGLTPHDYDLCSAACPQDIRRVFADFPLVLAGEKHGTIGIVTGSGVVEITAFRTEGGYRDARHPDWVAFVPEVASDLRRRDFTVNAMAWSPTRGFADPFGGQADLAQKCLRAVGAPETRFQEDPLRILRGVRFAVKYGLTPEEKTLEAMIRLAPLMDSLARERVFDELCKLLPLVTPKDLQVFAPILTAAIPELAPTVGFDQRSPHHAFDLYTHISQVTGAVPPTLSLRLAALLHDIGKVPAFTLDETGRGHFKGHAKVGSEMANEILLRLKAPTALRERVVLLIAQHMTPLEPDKALRRRINRFGLDTTRELVALQRADFGGKGLDEGETVGIYDQILAEIQQIVTENHCLCLKDLAISGKDLITIGFTPGKALGQCLDALLSQVLDGTLPNTREALLSAAKNTIPCKEQS